MRVLIVIMNVPDPLCAWHARKPAKVKFEVDERSGKRVRKNAKTGAVIPYPPWQRRDFKSRSDYTGGVARAVCWTRWVDSTVRFPNVAFCSYIESPSDTIGSVVAASTFQNSLLTFEEQVLVDLGQLSLNKQQPS